MRRKLAVILWALALVLGLGYAGSQDMEAERVMIERGME